MDYSVTRKYVVLDPLGFHSYSLCLGQRYFWREFKVICYWSSLLLFFTIFQTVLFYTVDHQNRNNVIHGSQRAAGVPGKRQVVTSTAFVHELSNHLDHTPVSSASSIGHHGSDLDPHSSRSAQSTTRTQYNSSVYLPGENLTTGLQWQRYLTNLF